MSVETVLSYYCYSSMSHTSSEYRQHAALALVRPESTLRAFRIGACTTDPKLMSTKQSTAAQVEPHQSGTTHANKMVSASCEMHVVPTASLVVLVTTVNSCSKAATAILWQLAVVDSQCSVPMVSFWLHCYYYYFFLVLK